MKLIPYYLLGLLFYQVAMADSLSLEEKKISNYIIENQNSQLGLLEKIVNINSGTDNIAGVKRVGKILQSQFEQLGFTTKWVDEPPSMKRAATLVAEHKGTKGKRLLLIGHLDTVFPKESGFQKYELHGKMAKGPGIIDDKGGDVVIIYALKAMKAAHVLDNASITVVLTGDEEESGKPTSISRKPLFEAAKHSDIALDFEPGSSMDTASIARRGISNWKIETQGRQAHSADIFQSSGDGAIFELARILNTMRSELSKEQYLTFNPGLILGGTDSVYEKNNSRGKAAGKENVIAKTAMATGDLRYISSTQKLEVEKRIQAIVNQHLAKTTASISFQDGIPAMPPTANNLELLNKYSQVSSDLGFGEIKPLDPKARGAGDISHIAEMVTANLVGLGPLGGGVHSIKEIMDVQSLSAQTQKAALLMYRLTAR